MDDKVKLIIDTMRQITADNVGVIIEPLGQDDGVLRIKYSQGTNNACPDCVMQPDSFSDMVQEMCKVQAPYITEVRVIPVK